jgi:integrase
VQNKADALDFYAPLKGLSPRTVDLYGYSISAMSAFVGRPATVDDFDELMVARFLAARRSTHSVATVAKDRAQIHALWEFAARRGFTKHFPTIALVKIPERVPESWLTCDVESLLESCALEQTHIASIPSALWWRACILVCYQSAERINAVLSLKWGDCVGCSLLFRAEGRKGQTRDILREVTVECADAMLAIRNERRADQHVFPWDRGHSYLWKRMGIILERAGLPATRRDKFHRLRRTCASYFAAAGGDAQRLLDHADPATTRKYVDPRIAKTPQACNLIPKVG